MTFIAYITVGIAALGIAAGLVADHFRPLGLSAE